MRTSVLVLLVATLVSFTSSECLDGNCTEPEGIPVLRIKFGSIFPFSDFGPVDIGNEQNHFDEAIDPFEPVTNSSEAIAPPEGVPSINIMEVVDVSDNDNVEDLSDFKFPRFPPFFEQSDFMDIFGTLELSGSSFTGEELAEQLKTREILGQPVRSLILSNSRIQGLTAGSFEPVENSLQELKMDNCSVNLDALINLSKLQRLNLSNTGLSTFQWYPKLRDTLQVLDLSHNQFVEVRPELSILTSLQELYLSHNQISSVSENTLAFLSNLEVLSLTMNILNDATFTSLYKYKNI